MLVAAEIREAESAVIEYMQKAFHSSAILHVRPARFSDGRHVEAIAVPDKGLFVRAETVSRIRRLLDAFIEVAAALLPLLLFDERGKCELCETPAMGFLR
jgi:hypothetical protein